jgi:hypothetical protein
MQKQKLVDQLLPVLRVWRVLEGEARNDVQPM